MMAMMMPATSMPRYDGTDAERPQMPDIGVTHQLPVLEIRFVALRVCDAADLLRITACHLKVPFFLSVDRFHRMAEPAPARSLGSG
jgi:hypothetical protein